MTCETFTKPVEGDQTLTLEKLQAAYELLKEIRVPKKIRVSPDFWTLIEKDVYLKSDSEVSFRGFYFGVPIHIDNTIETLEIDWA
jgi:hypothetical protein